MVDVWLQLYGTFVDEGVHVVKAPVAVTLDAQAVAETLIFLTALEEIGGACVNVLQDLELHRKLRDCLAFALGLHYLLDLCFEAVDRFLVIVTPRDGATSWSGSW